MKLSAFLYPLLLTSTGILAAPALSSEERLALRIQGRKDRRSNEASQFPIPAVLSETKGPTAGIAGNATIYSTNWAGGIIQTPPSGTEFFAIAGSFVVPLPAPPVAGAGTWYGTAWVGIYDSDAILQSGVDWGVTVSSTGAYSYQFNAWWEWYPNGWTDYDLVINAGDQITVLCDAGSTSSANCATTNHNTGVSVDTGLTAPGTATLQGAKCCGEFLYSPSPLPLQPPAIRTLSRGPELRPPPQWIVEDFSSGGLVPFANFGTVTFTDCIALAGVDFTNGQNVYPNSGTATPIDIVANGVAITQVTFPEDTTNIVEVTYI